MESQPHPVARSRTHRSRRLKLAVVIGLVAGAGAAATASGIVGSDGRPGPQGDGTAVTPTGWKVTPIGKQVSLGERPYGITPSPDGKTLLVSNDGVDEQSLMVVDAATGATRQTLPYPAPEALFLGVAYSPDGKHAYASGGQNDEVHAYDAGADGKLTETDPIALDTFDDDGERLHPFPAGLTVSPDNETLYVADHFGNALSIVDIASGDETRVKLSDRTCVIGPAGDPSNGRDCLFPYGVQLSEDGSKAYVSNWGQRSVSVVDTGLRSLVRTIGVGTHPSAMTLAPKRHELFVANSDGDSVSVIDTRSSTVRRTTRLHPYSGAPVGSNPNALAVTPDERRLYVANAGNNDLTVLGLGKARDRRLGYIPTGWYPTGVLLDPTGKRLYVANAKGLGAGPNPGGPVPGSPKRTPTDQYIGSMIRGTLSIVDARRSCGP